MVKLDIGCGSNKKEGFVGVDRIAFDGVDLVHNVGQGALPYEDTTVDEIHASHFVEHLPVEERIFFFNDIYRVLKPGAKATIVVPHYASGRAYGDPTHVWPPVSEFSFYYLNKKWRLENAPHTDSQHWTLGYSCDFDSTWGYGLHSMLLTRNQEFQQFAINFYREAAQDIHATLVKRELSA